MKRIAEHFSHRKIFGGRKHHQVSRFLIIHTCAHSHILEKVFKKSIAEIVPTRTTNLQILDESLPTFMTIILMAV
jgi:hypothetical protein